MDVLTLKVLSFASSTVWRTSNSPGASCDAASSRSLASRSTFTFATTSGRGPETRSGPVTPESFSFTILQAIPRCSWRETSAKEKRARRVAS